MPDVILTGVRPEPLAGYLKAVAMLRIVGEQADHGATGAWRGDTFVLRSALDAGALVDFMLTRWAPSPIVSPWNSSSGFGGEGAQIGIQAIRASTDTRFATWKAAIRESELVLASHAEAAKADLLAALRARLSDDALRWLDAAAVLTADGPRYASLLGTGGNDGRLEFGNNQMQRIAELLVAPVDAALPRMQLERALFSTSAALDRNASIGQFAPGSAGGSNAGMGFERDALINPWDFVLSLEGALTFAAAATRALDLAPMAAFPFYVRATSAGYASAASADDESSRGELWLPLWSSFATSAEIGALAGEGRAWVGSHPARTGADFARAIRQLGVARGIGSFQRYALAQRNGLAFLATPAGRYAVTSAPDPDPVTAIEGWLDRVRPAARDDKCPGRVRTALQRLDSELLAPSRADDSDERLLLAVSALAAAVLRSRRHSTLELVPPCPAFPPGSWGRLLAADDPAWRLGFAAARAGLRSLVQPITNGARLGWAESGARAEMAPEMPLVRRLVRVGRTRLRSESGCWSLVAPRGAGVSLPDLQEFVANAIGDDRLAAVMDAALLVQEPSAQRSYDAARTRPLPVALALCLCALHGPPDYDGSWPVPSLMLEALAAGRGDTATRMAVRHLRAHDADLALGAVPVMTDAAAVRIAAALVFPLSGSALRDCWCSVANPSPDSSRLPA